MTDSIKVRAKVTGGVTEVKALINHAMETGQRKDAKTGQLIPAHFIQEITCTHNGENVLTAQWGFISRSQTNQTLKQIAKKTKLVLPLYNEEVHILGRSGINSFGDLAGRKVAIGEECSGTYLTARLIFEISEIAPAENG